MQSCVNELSYSVLKYLLLFVPLTGGEGGVQDSSGNKTYFHF